MSLAKATFSGCVYREPQMRSTSNNVPITYFTFDISTDDSEELIRVRSIGNMAENVAKSVKKNDRLVVEGSLMMTSIKDESGNEKRIVELSMNSYEKLSGSSNETSVSNSSTQKPVEQESLVKFTNDTPDDLIDDCEIPF